ASIPAELERVILTCLAKEPSDRYQSADDLRADLMRFRRGQPVVGTAITAVVTTVPDSTTVASAVPADRTAIAAAPVPVATRSPQKKKSNRGPIIAIIAALVVLIGVIAFVLVSQLGGDGGSTVQVANVVGQQVGPARTLLEGQGFDVTVN